MRNFTLKFNSLFDLQAAFPTEKSCIRFLEQIRWNGNVISPFSPASKVYKRNDGSYRCKNSGKNFNARIGTIFESSKLPLKKWFMAIYMLTSNKKGVSSMQLAKDIHITQKTAWFLTQRIRETFTKRISDKLTGEVEFDETFVGGKNKNRHWNKKAKKCQGRSFVDKVPVLGMLERGGRVICKVVRNISYKQLTAPILRNVERNVMLYMDE
ncbi:Transposase and inactivated derivatives [Prevotella intermedia]|nr:Transposase and inactivated derivatives [Prevotella intermedia]